MSAGHDSSEGEARRSTGSEGAKTVASPPHPAKAKVGHGGPAARAALATLAEMVPDLARSLGPDHEVVLHDLRLIPNSIVAIGGELTGRKVGGPTTDLLLRLVHQGHHDNVLRYQTRAGDGRVFRASTLFIRDPDGKPVGCLCINTDITNWLRAQALLSSVTKVTPLDSQAVADDGGEPAPVVPSDADDGGVEEPRGDSEIFPPSVDELAVSLVARAIESVGVPVELMQKPHKLRVVRELEDSGFFLLRDAVDLTARMLSISRYSVYGYLRELKGDTGPGAGRTERRGRRRLSLADRRGPDDAEEVD